MKNRKSKKNLISNLIHMIVYDVNIGVVMLFLFIVATLPVIITPDRLFGISKKLAISIEGFLGFVIFGLSGFIILKRKEIPGLVTIKGKYLRLCGYCTIIFSWLIGFFILISYFFP